MSINLPSKIVFRLQYTRFPSSEDEVVDIYFLRHFIFGQTHSFIRKMLNKKLVFVQIRS